MPSGDERQKQLHDRFREALELGEGEREPWLERLGADQPELLADLRELLRLHGTPSEPLWSARAAAVAALPSSRASGTRLGPYTIEAELGHGGMGTVYLARRADRAFDKQVAIKLVRGGLGRDALLARFRAERAILARLEHPAIARLMDAGTTEDGLPFLVMEHVAGRRLDEHCREKRLGLRGRVALALEVCDAVHYAHQRLVVHRDLKPGNILVGEDGTPKLLDFGVAKLLEPGSEWDAVTRTGHALLTPEYASPEQVRGEPVDVTTDVYGLGALLYELLSGEPPHRLSNRSPEEIVRVVCHSEPQRPSQAVSASEDAEGFAASCGLTRDGLADALRGDLDAILLKALRSEPASRYASAEALAADLRRLLDGRPVEARAGGFRYRAGKFLRRHRVEAGLAAAALALLLAFTVSTTGLSIRLSRQQEQLAREARTSEETARFLVDMFREADPMRLRGEEMTVREVLDRGAEQLADSLEDRPVVRARLFSVLGAVYHNIGSYDRSIALLERGLEAARSAGDAPASLEVGILDELGEVKRAAGYLDDSVRTFREALSLVEDPATEARLRRLLAGPLYVMGRFDEAEREARRAVAFHEGVGAAGLEAAEAWSRLAEIFHFSGNFGAAVEPLRKALPVYARELGRDHLFYLRAEITLSNSLRQMGDLAAAEPLARHAAEASQRVLDPGHPGIGRAINQLALQRHDDGSLRESAALFEQAAAAYLAVNGDQRVYVAHVRRNLAEVLEDAGELRDAVAVRKAVAEGLAQALAPDDDRVVRAQANLAWLLGRLGRSSEARSVLDDAFGRLESASGNTRGTALLARAELERLGGQPERARGTAQEARALLGARGRGAVDVLTLLGRLELAARRYEGAEALLRDALGALPERYPDDHPARARVEALRAEALRGLGREDEALALARAARGALEAAVSPGDADLARLRRLEAALG